MTSSITASLEARLLVETVEIRPGRHVAVHHRPSSTSKPRIFFVHGSCASMLQVSVGVRTSFTVTPCNHFRLGDRTVFTCHCPAITSVSSSPTLPCPSDLAVRGARGVLCSGRSRGGCV